MSKKNILFLFIIFLIIISFSFINKQERSYVYNYNVGTYKVVEKYNKDMELYTFLIEGFKFNIKSDYLEERKLVGKVDIVDNCISIEGKLPFFTMCKDGLYYSSYEFHNDYEKKGTYKEVNMYNLSNKTYLLWNYKGFIIINKETQKEIKILNKDEYKPVLIKRLDNNYLIPNYDQDYYFNSYYLLNLDTFKYKLREMKHEYSYDLVYLDKVKKEINLYDVKEEKEYTLEFEKGLSTHNKGIKYTKQELEEYKEEIYFRIKNNNLIYKLSDFELIILEDMDVNIVYSNDFEVYFLYKDTLYVYNLVKGFNKILSYKEWKFNHKNLIYIV